VVLNGPHECRGATAQVGYEQVIESIELVSRHALTGSHNRGAPTLELPSLLRIAINRRPIPDWLQIA
jgi:hypothetical protein